MHINKNYICLILSLIGICSFFIGCADKELHPDDVEYRIDDNGTELLFQIGREYPFAYGDRAFIVDHYENGKLKFKIGFQNGKKDGNFTFGKKTDYANSQVNSTKVKEMACLQRMVKLVS